MREQRRLLVNGGDPERTRHTRIVVANLLAKYGQASRISREGSGHDFDERGFSRAVLANQRVDFSGPQLERNIVQRVYARERFSNRCCLKNVQIAFLVSGSGSRPFRAGSERETRNEKRET